MKLSSISPDKKQEIANLLLNTQDSSYIISIKSGIYNIKVVRCIGKEFIGDLSFLRENLAMVKMLKDI